MDNVKKIASFSGIIIGLLVGAIAFTIWFSVTSLKITRQGLANVAGVTQQVTNYINAGIEVDLLPKVEAIDSALKAKTIATPAE